MKTTTTDKPQTVKAAHVLDVGAIEAAHVPATPEVTGAAQPLDDVGRLLGPYKAVRMMLRPHIVNLWTWSTTGATLNSPRSAADKLALLAKLPSAQQLTALDGRLSAAMSQTAGAEDCAAAVAMMSALHPNLGTDRGGYVAGLVFALHMEAEVNGWPPCVVAAAAFIAIRRTKFLPTLAEVLEAAEIAHKEFQQAIKIIPRTFQAVEAIEDELIRLGVVLYADDGMEF